MPNWSTALRDDADYRHIKNLWINSNGAVIKNPMRPLIQDLDRLPFPAYGRDSFYFIGSNEVIREDPTLTGPGFGRHAGEGMPLFVFLLCEQSFAAAV